MSDIIGKTKNAWTQVIQIVGFAFLVASTTIAASQGIYIRAQNQEFDERWAEQNQRIIELRTDFKGLDTRVRSLEMNYVFIQADVLAKLAEVQKGQAEMKSDIKELAKR